MKKYMYMNKSYDASLKIIMVGESNVGKTSILHRYINECFPTASNFTIGVDFSTKILTLDNRTYKLLIWDTAGQERYHSITKSYFRETAGVILVYDMMERNTLEKCKIWYDSVMDKNIIGKNMPSIILVGNKCDLLGIKRGVKLVSLSEAKEFALSHLGTNLVLECSAKHNINIGFIFEILVDDIYKKTIEDLKLEEMAHTIMNETTTNRKTIHLTNKGITIYNYDEGGMRKEIINEERKRRCCE